MFLEELQANFNTDCLYELLGVDKKCDEKELKKGYYRQSMRWHPDKSNLDEEAKTTHTTKFQLLNKAYQILSDAEKRKIYDETGCVDDEAGELNEDVLKAWRQIFKKVTKEDIDNFMETYQGSEEQKRDLIKEYNKWDGNIAKIRECVIGFEDVEELKKALDTLLESGEIRKTKKYGTSTSETRMRSYKRKAEKEAAEFENVTQVRTGSNEQSKIYEKLSDADLVALIRERRQKSATFLDSLADKYAAASSSKKTKRK